MKKSEIASLACKILSIYLVIQGITILSLVLSMSFGVVNQTTFEIIINLIYPILYFLLGIFLWHFSDKLSNVMVKGETNTNEFSQIKAGDIQRIVFSVLGLYFVGGALPKLVSTVINFYTVSELSTNFAIRSFLGAGGVITQLIFGLGIFFGSQGLVKLLDSVRDIGMKERSYKLV